MSKPEFTLSDQEALIRRILKQRERWIEVEPGKELCVRRPDRWGSLQFLRDRSAEQICSHVIDWRGFTEEDLLGPGLGTIDETPFRQTLFRVIAGDRIQWLQKVVDTITEQLKEADEQEAAAQKN